MTRIKMNSNYRCHDTWEAAQISWPMYSTWHAYGALNENTEIEPKTLLLQLGSVFSLGLSIDSTQNEFSFT